MVMVLLGWDNAMLVVRFCLKRDITYLGLGVTVVTIVVEQLVASARTRISFPS